MPPHDFWLFPPRAHATHVLEHTKHYIFVAQVTNPLKATVRAPLFLLLCCCRRPTLRPSPPYPHTVQVFDHSLPPSPPLLLHHGWPYRFGQSEQDRNCRTYLTFTPPPLLFYVYLLSSSYHTLLNIMCSSECTGLFCCTSMLAHIRCPLIHV